MFDNNPEEHYIKEGDPGKPTYYIIRRMDKDTNLSALYRMTMGHVWYALSKGWLPVVDMQNYPNAYLAPEKLGKENSWEYYFEQPFGVGVKQAYDGENVILSNGDCVKPFPDYSMNLSQKKNEELTEWRMLIKMGFLTVKPQLKEEILAMREEIFSLEDNILGVLLRGRDYSDKKIKGQPIPPPVEFARNKAREKFDEWACNKILLITEDKAVVELFRDNFGNKCVNFDQIYTAHHDTDEGLSASDNTPYGKDDYFMWGKRHLAQMILLSSCNSFLAEKCGGTTSTMLLATKFEHTHFFNLGEY